MKFCFIAFFNIVEYEIFVDKDKHCRDKRETQASLMQLPSKIVDV